MGTSLVIALCLAICPQVKATAVTTRATGTFKVKLTPQPVDGELLSRMTIDKQFHGDLEATSTGQMLAAGTAGP